MVNLSQESDTTVYNCKTLNEVAMNKSESPMDNNVKKICKDQEEKMNSESFSGLVKPKIKTEEEAKKFIVESFNEILKKKLERRFETPENSEEKFIPDKSPVVRNLASDRCNEEEKIDPSSGSFSDLSNINGLKIEEEKNSHLTSCEKISIEKQTGPKTKRRSKTNGTKSENEEEVSVKSVTPKRVKKKRRNSEKQVGKSKSAPSSPVNENTRNNIRTRCSFNPDFAQKQKKFLAMLSSSSWDEETFQETNFEHSSQTVSNSSNIDDEASVDSIADGKDAEKKDEEKLGVKNAVRRGRPPKEIAQMKNKSDRRKSARFESPAEKSPAKRSVEMDEETVIIGDKDRFCWRCHRVDSFHSSVQCVICPRVYHVRCIRSNTGSPEGTDNWSCPECTLCLKMETYENQSQTMKLISADEFCSLLSKTVEFLSLQQGAEVFMEPVDLVQFPNYPDCIVNPVTLKMIKKNIDQKVYGSTESFIADIKWLHHNSVIFNGLNSPLTSIAKSILVKAKTKMNQLEQCVDCFKKSFDVTSSGSFLEACRQPHLLVWAKFKGYPFWPSKVFHWKMDSKNNYIVDVKFFNDYSRAWVPAKSVYLFSKKSPSEVTLPNAKDYKSYHNAVAEAQKHIENLELMFGKFDYAPLKTEFIPENYNIYIKLMLPEFDPLKLEPKNTVTLAISAPTSKSTKNKSNTDVKPTVKKLVGPKSYKERKLKELQVNSGSDTDGDGILYQNEGMKKPKIIIEELDNELLTKHNVKLTSNSALESVSTPDVINTSASSLLNKTTHDSSLSENVLSNGKVMPNIGLKKKRKLSKSSGTPVIPKKKKLSPNMPGNMSFKSKKIIKSLNLEPSASDTELSKAIDSLMINLDVHNGVSDPENNDSKKFLGVSSSIQVNGADKINPEIMPVKENLAEEELTGVKIESFERKLSNDDSEKLVKLINRRDKIENQVTNKRPSIEVSSDDQSSEMKRCFIDSKAESIVKTKRRRSGKKLCTQKRANEVKSVDSNTTLNSDLEELNFDFSSERPIGLETEARSLRISPTLFDHEGSATRQFNFSVQQLVPFVSEALSNMMVNMANAGNKDILIQNLRLELEDVKQKHIQEISSLKHIMNQQFLEFAHANEAMKKQTELMWRSKVVELEAELEREKYNLKTERETWKKKVSQLSTFFQEPGTKCEKEEQL